MHYRISLAEELSQVEKAIGYYLDWAEEFRTTPRETPFIAYYYRGLLDPSQETAIRWRALYFAMRLQPVMSYIDDFHRQHGRAPRILDLGCGFGLESMLLSRQGAVVHGVDGDAKMIIYANK